MAVVSIKDFVTITFDAIKDDSITLSESGIVCLFLQDLVGKKGTYTITNKAQIPDGLAPTNQKSIELALLGKPRKVIAVIEEGTADAVAIDTASAAFKSLETLQFNYLAIPGINSSDATKVATWAKTVNENPMNAFCAVLPNTEGDSQYVVNYAHESITIGGTAYTTTQATPYVAATIAATVPNESMTRKRAAVEDCTPMSIAEVDAAGNAGKLVLYNDGKGIYFASDCNSLTTVGESINETYQDLRSMEIRNLFYNSAKTALLDKYISKYGNSYQHKLLVVGKLYELLKDFEKSGLVEQGDSDVQLNVEAQTAYLSSINYKTKDGRGVQEMSRDEILRANTRKKVFVKIRMIPLQAIEAIDIQVHG